MANALQHETSPYLLQHADNPVDWMPWGPAALERARERGKPILLSIGYSACHWCHVMAHESFEDADTAAVMNDLYVNIKVDREERPDLDRIYQTSQQLLSGRPGGWPLTVFLTPDEQLPFFAGTYFPKHAAYGMPSFKDVLTRVADYFESHREEIDRNGVRLQRALEQIGSADGAGAARPERRLIKQARLRLGDAFDASHGGFGQAPKFPHAAEIGFLLGRGADDEGARLMAEASLRAMTSGGLFDHLRGGFFRYCVDADWRIPHFEKMLYDNAALLGTLSEAHVLTGDDSFRDAALATADWLIGDMQDPGGGFYATLDADSEGEEGRYYTFARADFETLLDADECAAASAYFGLDEPPNFENRAWHLQPRARALPFAAVGPVLASARQKLLAARVARPPPGRDDKILTAWNGLLAANLARAARLLDAPALGREAERALDFIRAELWQDGRLRASYKDGRARFAGYLDDYALTAHALLELVQWQFRPQHLQFAIELTDCMLEHFADARGGFFFTADDHEQLIHRPKPLADESLPSGNGIAALVLDTLGHLLGETAYLDHARSTVAAALPSVQRYPEAHATLLAAVERELEPPALLVVRAGNTELDAWRDAVGHELPAALLQFWIPDDAGELPGLLATRRPEGRPTAYWCRGTACEAPAHDIEALRERLRSGV
jgi:uncharacterized protein YyaL (SSP411 family)